MEANKLFLSADQRQELTQIKLFLDNPFSDSIDVRYLPTGDWSKTSVFRSVQITPQYWAELRTQNGAESAHFAATGGNGSVNRAMLQQQMFEAATQFLAKRTKQEFVGLFFDKFKKELKQKQLLQFVFPTSQKLLNFQNPSSTPTLSKTWSNVFETDLKNTLFNIEHFMRSRAPQSLQQVEGQLFTLSLQSIKLSSEGAKTADVIRHLDAQFSKNSGENSDLAKGLKLVNAFSQSLFLGSKNGDYTPRDSLQTLDTEGFAFYLGFVYQRNKTAFKKMNLVPTMQNLPAFAALADEFLTYADQIKSLETPPSVFALSETPDSEEKRSGQSLQRAQLLLQMLELGNKARFYAQNEAPKYYTSEFYTQKMRVPRSTLLTFQAMQNRQYGIALLNVAEVVEALTPSLRNTSAETELQGLKRFLYYANFMADIIAAPQGADLGGIVEKYALPSGSFRAKRTAKFTLDISSYPGFFVGGEFVRDARNISRGGAVNGVTIPIGLSFNFGSKSGHSASVFVPVIDAGGALSYRWGSDKGSGLPEEFKMSQVFALGGYLVWGIKGAPMVVMLGVQHTPNLRVVDEGQSLKQSGAFRVGLNVCMDLPVFGLYR